MKRPILYGLAAGDKEGVKTVITEVAEELRGTTAMTGMKGTSSVKEEFVL